MVLPAPFGPLTSTISPTADVEITPRERRETIQEADDGTETDDEGHAEPPGPPAGVGQGPKVYGRPEKPVEPATLSRPGTSRGASTVIPVRRAILLFGQSLITVGLLLLLFVAYQLWGTNFYEAAQQDSLKSSFRRDLAETRAATSAPEPRRPAANEPPTTTTTTQPLPPPPEGEPLGIVRIPSLGVDRAMVQGITVPDLRKGPGHYPDSPLPGQLGNVAIAGHRTTYGAPFNRIDELVPGDEITIVTLSGTYHYSVTGQQIVSPRDVGVLNPTPNATLTLTTCNPKYSARQRLIVTATLDEDKSPTPVAPPASAVAAIQTAHLELDDLAGERESKTPVIWWGIIVAAIGGAWWFLFHRRPKWYVWVGGAIPFLAVYALFCFFLERVLPPGF